jgi:hypothetical protein
MVKVHHFKIWNKTKEDWEIPPSKRTAEDIAQLNGIIIGNSAEEIDLSRLDRDGRYFPLGSALIIPVEKRRQKFSESELNEKLDGALEESFPASDPVAVGRCSHMGKPKT